MRMTKPVYYLDPYAKKIKATVVDYREKNGDHWLLLDQTIFYPGGGGQLPDRGTVNGKPLLELRQKDGQIWHKVDFGSNAQHPQSPVTLELEWNYRYYQMQQHTGQHLLSAVLHAHGWPTVSVHLGEEYTLIEVEGSMPEPAMLKQMENEALQLIARALPVTIHYVENEQAQKLPLRRPPKEMDTLRIVEIDGFDFSACGGTHLRSLAEIGMIKIMGSEKIRGHARIKALIGQKAFQYFEELHQVSGLLKEKLNTDHLHFNDRIAQLQEEISYLKKLKKFYQHYFLDFESARLASLAGSEPLIVHTLHNGEQSDAAELAKKLSREFGKIAFIRFDRRFFLSSPSPQKFDTIKFLKNFADSLEIKGGGPQGFCQGIMNRNNLQQIAETIKIHLR